MNRRLFLHAPLTAAGAALLAHPGATQAAPSEALPPEAPPSQDHVFDSVWSWLEAVCTRGGKFVRVDLAPDVNRVGLSEENYLRLVDHAKVGLLHVETGKTFWIPLRQMKNDRLKPYLRQWLSSRTGREKFAQRVSEEPATVLGEARLELDRQGFWSFWSKPRVLSEGV